MAEIYTVREYDSFVRGKSYPGYTTLPESTFDSFEQFILANNSKDDDIPELMGVSAKKGVGKVITAKNYVGVITMTDGTTIEILPKVYDKFDADEYRSKQKAKKLLLKMLRNLTNAPYKTMQKSNLDTDKLSMFEIFIRMFADEVFAIVKHGLKCNYESRRDNLNVFKGKLLFGEHIKYNAIHKQKFFVEYDEFNANCAENRILKSTLLYLYRRTSSNKNKNDIRTLLNSFLEVDESADYHKDFAKCIPDRNSKGYANALMWSRVFLQGKSFTAFSGSNVAVALLFPMEKLFESHVASLMRKSDAAKGYEFSFQDKRYHLFDTPKKLFKLKPDIVASRKSDSNVFVMDTKWKILKANKLNYGISQADMYQMYAYQKKYSSESTTKNITLIYPETEEYSAKDRLTFKSQDGVTVYARFINLYDDNGAQQLLLSID